MLGNAGGFALETATVTTSEKLANLMFQLQMTGYMFKNAEYRISLSQSLSDVPALPPGVSYTAAAAGGSRTVLLRSDGAAVAFGFSGDGQTDVPELPPGLACTP